MMLVAAFGTLWMPNQATSAMLFPIAWRWRWRCACDRPEQLCQGPVLSLAWGAMVGSNASFSAAREPPWR